jgi:Ran GTPase-activating protein (RanGAP) involved in mRNA processing and transport
MDACRALKVVPVQQFISMLDQDIVSLKHRGVGAVGGRAICECLRHNQHNQALDMEDNQLGLNANVERGDLDPMCNALAHNAVLTNLDLSYNNLAGLGCAAVAKALEKNQGLVELSLRGNNMGDSGAQTLGAALRLTNRIVKLDVSDNGIGASGGAALGDMVQLAGLKQADFSWNCVCVAGARAIAEGLKRTAVVRLNLAWNGLGERGAEAIGEVHLV